MPTSTECLYEGRLISISEALLIKKRTAIPPDKSPFICHECGNPVRPHRRGGNNVAHFEHLERHPECSLSHKHSNADSNPDWVRDELILALDIYLRYRPNPPSKGSKDITQLSQILRRLAIRLFQSPDLSESFRNENGVYMKLMNFRRFDPEYTSDGKKGLTRGARGDRDVWNEFANDPARCQSVAAAIIASLDDESSLGLESGEDEDIAEAAEGRLLTREHLARERSRKLVRKKLDRVWKDSGKLECVVCGFDFAIQYGSRGAGFIECHHTKPLATLVEGHKTHLDDLALVCPNCHRMIHRRKPWLAIAELRALLQGLQQQSPH